MAAILDSNILSVQWVCYMMTSSNGNIFRVTGSLCAGNSPVTGEFPSQRPVTRSFDVFFDLRLNKQLSKQSRRRWYETSSCWLWRHYNDHTLCWCASVNTLNQCLWVSRMPPNTSGNMQKYGYLRCFRAVVRGNISYWSYWLTFYIPSAVLYTPHRGDFAEVYVCYVKIHAYFTGWFLQTVIYIWFIYNMS